MEKMRGCLHNLKTLLIILYAENKRDAWKKKRKGGRRVRCWVGSKRLKERQRVLEVNCIGVEHANTATNGV